MRLVFRETRSARSGAPQHSLGAKAWHTGCRVPGVRVSFAVKTPEADVAQAVTADLRKDVFDETLYSRMGEQGLHASRVLLDAKSVATHQPSGLGGALKYAMLVCGFAAVAAVAYRSGKSTGAASVAVTDFASEEEKATLT